MPFIFENLTEAEIDAYGLVLSSSGISYHVEIGQHGGNIYVSEVDEAKAVNAVEAYLEENEAAQVPGSAYLQEYGKTLTGIWASLLLVGVHIAFALSQNRPVLFKIYGAAAGPILDGELYRVLTSLMIHANSVHLVGNIVGVALFGTVVCRIAGPGVGGFMILTAGAAGNFFNAMFYRGQHLSVGASTAVFAAVGILAAYQFSKKLKGVEGLRKSWLPLAGGLALLAFLGAGQHTDLMAHLFGFAAGVAIGAIYGFTLKRPPGKLSQVCFGSVVSGLIVFSWIWGSLGEGP